MSVLDQFSLKGKVVLVTGGPGLCGRQMVAAVAQAGAITYVADINIESAEKQAAQHQALGHNVAAIQYDQSDERSILALRDTVLARSGQVDALVNNAVRLPIPQKGIGLEALLFQESMRVNATGIFLMVRAFGDAMAKRGCGSIINIGSIHGLVGTDPHIYRGTSMKGWNPDYFFHKGGMINFTRFAGSYYGQYGVRCNCVCPGGLRVAQHPDTFVRQYSERTFLGRMANDTGLMGIIVFLASDASAYITGAIIPVDGGYTAR